MPRSSTGVYTLPVAAFVAGTVIKSADVNSDFSDIAFALTTSMATTGVSSMTGPIKLADGTVAAPSLTMASETDTGFYKKASDSWAWSINGLTDIIVFASTGLSVTGILTVSGNATVGGSLTVNGNLNVAGAMNFDHGTISYLIVSGTNTTLVTPGSSQLTFGAIWSNIGTVVTRPYVYTSDGNRSLLWYTGGQCRLILDGANLRLIPYMGNQISIYAQPREIPSVGVSLPASNTAAAFVYIYAYMNGSAMALEMSTTGYTYQAESGVQVKSTDNTRTLVGAAYTDTGGAWADTDGKLWVISYFNRKIKKSRLTVNTGANIVGATVTVGTELSSTLRNQFICWADEISQHFTAYSPFSSVASGNIIYGMRIDGTSASYNNYLQLTSAASVQVVANKMDVPTSTLTEAAVHFVSPYYVASAANVNVQVSNTQGGVNQNVVYILTEVMG